MVLEIPGLSLSILRQDTQTEAGKPVLISGRFTAFGLGLPAFVRVYLEGPDYNPEVTTFDAFAEPFSGNWSVQVVAQKDGNYSVYAEAYPGPAIPTGPLFPSNIVLVPPIAVSTKPPLVVGLPVPGGVNAQTPEGTQFLSTPAQSPLELLTTVGAPVISVSVPTPTTTLPTTPTAGLPPGYAPATPSPGYTPTAPTTLVPASALAINSPVQPGQSAVITFTGFQPSSSVSAIASGVGSTFGSADTLGAGTLYLPVPSSTPDGTYTAAITDSSGHSAQAFFVVQSLVAAAGLGQPPGTPTLQVPTFPDFLTASMVGTPLGDLRGQVNAGDIWSGYVQIPTSIPQAPTGFQQLLAGAPELPSYNPTVVISLEGTTGVRTEAARSNAPVQLGQPLYVPISFNTSALPEPAQGMTQVRYNVYLTIMNSAGSTIFDRNIGVLYVIYLPGVTPTGLPSAGGVPTIPTAPTAAMFAGTPTLNAPRILNLGDTWSGSLGVPTTVPSSLTGLPSLPQLPVTLGLDLKAPTDQTFPIASLPTSFQPGQSLSVPFNVDTNKLAGAGTYTLLLSVKDSLGNTIIPGQSIGPLAILPAPPTPPTTIPTGLPSTGLPTVPTLPAGVSQYTNPTVSLSPRTVNYGDTLNIPFTVMHQGIAETRTLRGSIGQNRGGFDEISYTEQQASFGLDLQPKSYSFNIPVLITTKLDPGTYGLQAKVEGSGPLGLIGQSVSPAIYGVIQVLAAPAAPSIGASTIPRVDVSIASQTVQPGSTLRIPFSYQHQGASENVTVYGAIGSKSTLGFDEKVHATKSLTIPLDQNLTSRTDSINMPVSSVLSPGQTYGVYVKLQRPGIGKPDVISPYQYNVITIAAAPLQPKLNVTGGVQQGGGVSFNYSGFPANARLYVSLMGGGGAYYNADPSGAGSGYLGPLSEKAGTYTLVADDGQGHKATAQFTITAAPTAAPAVNPKLTAPSSVNRYNSLSFSFSGFPPNTNVFVGVVGGGGVTVHSSTSGTGTGNFVDNDTPGSYTLQATAGSVKATAPFTVKSIAYLTAYVVARVLFYRFEGFYPSRSVHVYVQGGGGLNVTADSRGAYTGSFSVSEPSGPTYTLVAEDSYGDRATAQFKV
jgi:hypothetical protein